jgi:hypothetical protein
MRTSPRASSRAWDWLDSSPPEHPGLELIDAELRAALQTDAPIRALELGSPRDERRRVSGYNIWVACIMRHARYALAQRRRPRL